MKTPEGDKIFNILASHVGRENAISAPEIARLLRWRPTAERLVRRIIRAESPLWAEQNGLICAIPGEGYFFSKEFDELVTYYTWLTEGRDSYEERIGIVDRYCRARGIALHPHRRKKAA